MPKPIIIIEVGSIHHDLFCKSLDFMLTSHLTASIREEYHIMMFNETKEERCYILSANEKPVYIDPPPHTIDKLKKALSGMPHSAGYTPAEAIALEDTPGDLLEGKIINEILYGMYGVQIPESTIKHIIDYPGAAFTFGLTDERDVYIASIDFTGYNAKHKL